MTSSLRLLCDSARAAALLQALDEACGARAGVALRLHVRQKGDDGRTQVDALLDAARGSADGAVLGVLPKARAAKRTNTQGRDWEGWLARRAHQLTQKVGERR